MKYQPAVSALVRLHAELGGKIKENKTQARRLRSEMAHVEAVIKLLEPTFETKRIAVRRRVKTNPWFKRGEAYRYAVDVLRDAERPLTAREIAGRMIIARGVTHASKQQVQELAKGIIPSLRFHLGRTILKIGDGVPQRWMLIGELVPDMPLAIAAEID